jgi:hypothetical protein
MFKQHLLPLARSSIKPAMMPKLRCVALRAELLAGLALLYTHHHDPAPLVAVSTIAQQLILSTALGLDFQAHGTDAS